MCVGSIQVAGTRIALNDFLLRINRTITRWQSMRGLLTIDPLELAFNERGYSRRINVL